MNLQYNKTKQNNIFQCLGSVYFLSLSFFIYVSLLSLSNKGKMPNTIFFLSLIWDDFFVEPHNHFGPVCFCVFLCVGLGVFVWMCVCSHVHTSNCHTSEISFTFFSLEGTSWLDPVDVVK